MDHARSQSEQPANGKPFVGIHLKCCNVYTRAHLNAQSDAYVGWCPRCAAQVRIRVVQDGGSNSRFFEAS